MDYLGIENPHVRVMQIHPGSLDTAMVGGLRAPNYNSTYTKSEIQNKKAAEAGLVLPHDDRMLISPLFRYHSSTDNLIAELAAGFLVWAASPEAAFLKGKFLWVHWDIDELKAKKDELENSSQLTIGLNGWP